MNIKVLLAGREEGGSPPFGVVPSFGFAQDGARRGAPPSHQNYAVFIAKSSFLT
jgi:hypothetical protein